MAKPTIVHRQRPSLLIVLTVY